MKAVGNRRSPKITAPRMLFLLFQLLFTKEDNGEVVILRQQDIIRCTNCCNTGQDEKGNKMRLVLL